MANSIKEIMTTDVVTVRPETPLMTAVELLLKKDFNGLPVVDDSGKLVGIVTDEDLIIKGSSIHLPTFLKLLRDFQIFKKDAESISAEIKEILKMKVRDIMNPEPFMLSTDSSIVDAMDAFTRHHRINPIPVIEPSGKVAGIVSRYDLLKLYSAPSLNLDRETGKRDLDENVNRFVDDFGKHFLFVSRARTRYWLAASIIFLLIGFVIAFALILRVSF
ncbi:MAG: CBS domain-containing protein [Candidatus Doudnabacteria bacterium]|nr:CBS domain-containing protein [Candidatus Doudnabacteria bacterium]